MKKKLLSTILALLLAVAGGGVITACNDEVGSRTEIVFVSDGSITEVSVMDSLTQYYNDTQGKTDGVYVNYIYKGSDGYSQYVESTARGRNGPDVLLVNDRFFKRWAGTFGILADIGELCEEYNIEIDYLDDIYERGSTRFRYNISNNTSNEDDPLYGILRDLTPTILYYNKSAFEANGIIVISAYEDEIDEEFVAAFNAEHGLTDQHAVTVNDLKRGFYRENANIYSWNLPYEGETMVFNNRIPMSWDELEDLARINTKTYNGTSATTYGHYQWWWFNYGFSVGGDCIEDITGDGDWVFTVADDLANFIVADDAGTVTVNGKPYEPRETIEYIDRVNLTDTLRADLLANGSRLTGDSYLTDEVLGLEEEGKLIRLPSQQEAFSRWVMLAQKTSYSDNYGRGLEVSPIPSESTLTGSSGMFTSQEVAMLVEKSKEFLTINNAINQLSESNSFEWDVAPLPIYKEYDDVTGEVAASGNQAGASDANAYSINEYSSKKREALLFVKWAASPEAQDIIAEASFTLPNNASSGAKYVATNPDKNLAVIEEAAHYQTPGDWWYMPDRNWIESTWAPALNNQVRNQKMTLTEFFDTYVKLGNDALQAYKPDNG